ncbi:MAG: tetratricopeptide repeat protein [Candidatus Theseobacter exili]|nr:tetratricopeptide repeat protein [Candidatus Theseobacter exili]
MKKRKTIQVIAVVFSILFFFYLSNEADARGGQRFRYRFYRKIDTRQRAASHFSKGKKLYEKGDFKSALTAFDDAAKVHSDTADAYFWMGKVYLALDKEKKAQKMFYRYLKYFDKSINPSESMAFLKKDGFLDEEEAREYYVKLKKMLVEPDYWLFRGRTEVRIGESMKGIDSYKKGLEIDPDNFKLLQQIGRTLSDNGKYVEAVKYLQIVVNDSSNQVEGQDYASMGDSLRGLKKYDEAFKAYEMGLNKDPKSGYYRVVMAICCLNQGKRMEANHLLNTNIEEAPDFPFTYYFRGMILEQDFNNYREAIKNYKRFIDLLHGRKIPLSKEADKRIVELEKKLDESSK